MGKQGKDAGEMGAEPELQTLGRLTLEVVHDLRNPLSAISLSTSMLQRALRGRESLDGDALEHVRALVSDAVCGIEQLERIVQDVGSVAPQPLVAHVDVDDEVTRACRLAESTLMGRASLVRDQAAHACILSSRGALCRLTLNLIMNAVESIESAAASEHEVRVKTRSIADGVLIAVSDTGCGMPHGVRERIFDPFFSTKEAGPNSGLGLAIVQRIVKRHEGTIDVRSRRGQGSTFEIRLPARHDGAYRDSAE